MISIGDRAQVRRCSLSLKFCIFLKEKK